jgi:hypothetical protein
VLDAILLERRGVPAAAVCTRPFVPNGTTIAEAHGAAGYRFAVVDGPIGSADDAQLAAMADAVVSEVKALLER